MIVQVQERDAQIAALLDIFSGKGRIWDMELSIKLPYPTIQDIQILTVLIAAPGCRP